MLERRDGTDIGCTARVRRPGCVEVEIRLGGVAKTRRYSTEGVPLLVDPAGMLGLEPGEAIDRLAAVPVGRGWWQPRAARAGGEMSVGAERVVSAHGRRARESRSGNPTPGGVRKLTV